MSMPRRTFPLALVLALPLAAAVAAPACSGSGSATSQCKDVCSKQLTCGDLDAPATDQCRAKCDASADVAEANLDACLNKDAILSATTECLGRACSDYTTCLTTIPACKLTPGTSTGSATSTDTGTATSTDTGTGTNGACDPPVGAIACDRMYGQQGFCAEGANVDCNTSDPTYGGTIVAACSRTNLVGVCTGAGNTAFFSASDYTAADAKNICTSVLGGTWTDC